MKPPSQDQDQESIRLVVQAYQDQVSINLAPQDQEFTNLVLVQVFIKLALLQAQEFTRPKEETDQVLTNQTHTNPTKAATTIKAAAVIAVEQVEVVLVSLRVETLEAAVNTVPVQHTITKRSDIQTIIYLYC